MEASWRLDHLPGRAGNSYSDSRGEVDVSKQFGGWCRSRSVVGAFATRIAVSASVESVQAQGGGAPATGSKPIPRAADGKPDLSGVWITGALALLIGEEEARAI